MIRSIGNGFDALLADMQQGTINMTGSDGYTAFLARVEDSSKTRDKDALVKFFNKAGLVQPEVKPLIKLIQDARDPKSEDFTVLFNIASAIRKSADEEFGVWNGFSKRKKKTNAKPMSGNEAVESFLGVIQGMAPDNQALKEVIVECRKPSEP